MKVAHLLSEFLYSQKRLDLPGIGSFLLDPSVNTDADSSRSARNILTEGISFEANTAIRETPELISFIAERTGKIKALAAADLDSHLELARQFLNIGKPFLFEGIGSLSKLQSGQFSFTAGAIPVEKATNKALKENTDLGEEESQASGFRSIFYVRKTRSGYRKPMIAALLLVGIVLAVWGGYKVYKRTTAKNNTEEKGSEAAPPVTTSLSDTNQPANKTVSNSNTPSTAPVTTAPAANTALLPPSPAGSYKFIVETADKKRGLTRYTKLKGYGIDIKMETADSLRFKLFFVLPALASDTTRLIDSLRRLYTPAWDRAYVEN